SGIRQVLRALCGDCHNQETREAKLDLASLSEDLTDKAAFDTWVKVHDRVRDGEMPPKDAKQPKADERAALVSVLAANLHAADAARQRREGRALARRLNRDD